MQVDNFATPDESTTYMEGPECNADPVGVSFDADLMVEQLWSGAKLEAADPQVGPRHNP
jgi:hypothetical protein